MSKLNPSFDLHYDAKTTEDLKGFIEMTDNPKHIMDLMLLEITQRDGQIYYLRERVEAHLEKVSALDAIIEAQKELIAELTPTPKKIDRSSNHINTPIGEHPGEFCRFCGASIPHRYGEGRCPECEQHNDEHLLEKKPLVIPYEPVRLEEERLVIIKFEGEEHF